MSGTHPEGPERASQLNESLLILLIGNSVNIPFVLFFPFRVIEELTQQKLLLGLQVEELQSREDPLEVSFTPRGAGRD